MNSLFAAIQQQKQQRDQLKQATASAQQQQKQGTTWVRRGELEEARRAQMLKEHQQQQQQKKRPLASDNTAASSLSSTAGAADDESKPSDAKKRKLQSGEASEAAGGGAEATGDEDHIDEDTKLLMQTLSKDDVCRLLRKYGQPITYFGENDVARVRRLRRVQLQLGEHGKGQRNVDWAKDHLEKILLEEQRLREQEAAGAQTTTAQVQASLSGLSSLDFNGGGAAGTPASAATPGASSVALSAMDAAANEKHQELEQLPLQKDGQRDDDYVRRVLKALLREWQHMLESRPLHIKKTQQFKDDYATFKQTEEYLKPLFKQLKKQQIPDVVLTKLHAVVVDLANREYIKANDAYLRLSIGNAPWPMGVTMVGIHARSAREKISGGDVAHILNDEKTRKYIQSVKRLITFCQKRFPVDDPSQMVFS